MDALKALASTSSLAESLPSTASGSLSAQPHRHHRTVSTIAASATTSTTNPTSKQLSIPPKHRSSQSISMISRPLTNSSTTAANPPSVRVDPKLDRSLRTLSLSGHARIPSSGNTDNNNLNSMNNTRGHKAKQPSVADRSETLTIPQSTQGSKYELSQLPFNVPSLSASNENEAAPALGITVCQWSPDDQFLTTKNGQSQHHKPHTRIIYYCLSVDWLLILNLCYSLLSSVDRQPNTLWFWSIHHLSLHTVLQHLSPVSCTSINFLPVTDKAKPLSICFSCIGSSSVYMWQLDSCAVLDIPAPNFAVKQIKMNGTGSAFCVLDKQKFCILYQKI